ALQREVDQAEPRFLDAVMDPAKWGMARTLAQAMVTDGVDLSDPEATQRWIEQYNANLPDNPFDDLDLLEPDDDDELIDLKDAFGLPDRLPPLRLPPEDELAATARGVRLLDRAKQLALWVGERRRVTEDGDLTAA